MLKLLKLKLLFPSIAIHCAMYEFSTDPFHITTFPTVQYMIEGIDFTSRCVIQVDKYRKNHAKIHSQLIFYEGTCGNMTSEAALLQSDGSSVEIIINEQYDDNGDMWVIVEFTIFNTTDSKSGCYHCLAASFDHTDNSFSDVIFMQSKLAIRIIATISYVYNEVYTYN